VLQRFPSVVALSHSKRNHRSAVVALRQRVALKLIPQMIEISRECLGALTI
jgi:hypothetical protein